MVGHQRSFSFGFFVFEALARFEARFHTTGLEYSRSPCWCMPNIGLGGHLGRRAENYCHRLLILNALKYLNSFIIPYYVSRVRCADPNIYRLGTFLNGTCTSELAKGPQTSFHTGCKRKTKILLLDRPVTCVVQIDGGFDSYFPLVILSTLSTTHHSFFHSSSPILCMVIHTTTYYELSPNYVSPVKEYTRILRNSNY